MYRNLYEGVEGKPSAHAFNQRASEILLEHRAHQDIEKQNMREGYLLQHPEENITLNTVSLREIIPYAHLKCSPYSSLARNQAIRGSDIDGLTVTTAMRTSQEQQLSFVHELRRQGLCAYHQSEIDSRVAFEQQLFESWQNLENDDEIPPALLEFMSETGRMADQGVTFFTYKDIRDRIREGKLEMPLVIALAGKAIF